MRSITEMLAIDITKQVFQAQKQVRTAQYFSIILAMQFNSTS